MRRCAVNPRWIKCGLAAALLVAAAGAQTFSQRGFLDTRLLLFPQAAPNDSGHAVNEWLLREEPTWKPLPWLRFDAAFDARFDTHQETERTLHLDWQDRGLRRPALSVREFSATVRGHGLNITSGKQFIRWARADILNPLDRFAPKDYLTVIDPEILAVLALRITYEHASNTYDFVWQPRFTPSRLPLINERWTVLPAPAQFVSLHDLGSRFPGRSIFGARWNHTGAGYELAFSYYDGFNYLPSIEAAFHPATASTDFVRIYPALRQYGTDAAVPLRWFTVKTEAAWYTSPGRLQDEFVLYVVQIERQIKELTLLGGYAGDVVTAHGTAPLQFSPERGLARAFTGHALYTIDANRSVSADADIRQNGAGVFVRAVYSQTVGQHWRVSAGFALLRGRENDFLGQFHRNSHAILQLRYSF